MQNCHLCLFVVLMVHAWLCLAGEQPWNVLVAAFVVGELLLAHLTFSTAWAELVVMHDAISHGGACAPAEACEKYMYVAVMASLAGALAAFSARGMLWLTPLGRPRA